MSDKPFIPMDVLRWIKEHPDHCSECGYHQRTGHAPECSVAPATQPQRTDSQMSDERLDDLRSRIKQAGVYLNEQRVESALAAVLYILDDVLELLGENARLKRALQLSEASRGRPSQYQQLMDAAEHHGPPGPGLLGRD